MHPLAHEAFRAPARPRPGGTLQWAGADGTRGPMAVYPEAPGTLGAPVVLWHTAGVGPEVFGVGGEASVVQWLQRAGFRVYVPSLRGDPGVEEGSTRGRWLQGLTTSDAPAILQAVCEESGAHSALCVGHGLGGQLVVAALSRRPDLPVAAVACLSSPVWFARGRSRVVARILRSVHQWAPNLKLPAQHLSRWLALGLGPGAGRPMQREVLCGAVENLPLGVVLALEAWWSEGTLALEEGRWDVLEGLQQLRTPLFIGMGVGDRFCSPEACLRLRHDWGGPVEARWFPDAVDHFDVVVASPGVADYWRGLAEWLTKHQLACFPTEQTDVRRVRPSRGRSRRWRR